MTATKYNCICIYLKVQSVVGSSKAEYSPPTNLYSLKIVLGDNIGGFLLHVHVTSTGAIHAHIVIMVCILNLAGKSWEVEYMSCFIEDRGIVAHVEDHDHTTFSGISSLTHEVSMQQVSQFALSVWNHCLLGSFLILSQYSNTPSQHVKGVVNGTCFLTPVSSHSCLLTPFTSRQINNWYSIRIIKDTK